MPEPWLDQPRATVLPSPLQALLVLFVQILPGLVRFRRYSCRFNQKKTRNCRLTHQHTKMGGQHPTHPTSRPYTIILYHADTLHSTHKLPSVLILRAPTAHQAEGERNSSAHCKTLHDHGAHAAHARRLLHGLPAIHGQRLGLVDHRRFIRELIPIVSPCKGCSAPGRRQVRERSSFEIVGQFSYLRSWGLPQQSMDQRSQGQSPATRKGTRRQSADGGRVDVGVIILSRKEATSRFAVAGGRDDGGTGVRFESPPPGKSARPRLATTVAAFRAALAAPPSARRPIFCSRAS